MLARGGKNKSRNIGAGGLVYVTKPRMCCMMGFAVLTIILAVLEEENRKKKKESRGGKKMERKRRKRKEEARSLKCEFKLKVTSWILKGSKANEEKSNSEITREISQADKRAFC